MQALSVTEGPVWGGGLHAADTRAKMFVSLLASVATVALSGVEPQMVLFGMSLVYALGMRRFRILLIGYAALVGMSLLAMGCAFGMALLKDLNEKLGVTVVVITHQMSVIEEICSRVAILDGGVVAEQGKVEDIFSNPHTDAARRLVYPGGVSLEQYPAGTHAVRVAFNGGTAYQPLIASLAIDLGVKVNILGADTRNIEGRAFGTMLLGLPDDPNEAAKALSYIRAQPNVSAEEVEYHV